jgi:hypothetical protein
MMWTVFALGLAKSCGVSCLPFGSLPSKKCTTLFFSRTKQGAKAILKIRKEL